MKCVAVALTILGCLVMFSRDAEGGETWHKGALHLHTLWSDGDAAPELLAAWYKENGWNFVCFTEHNTVLSGERWEPVADNAPLTEERLQSLKDRFGEDSVTLQRRMGRLRMRLKTIEELKRQFDEPGGFLLMMGEEITSMGGNPHVGAINVVTRTGGTAVRDHGAVLRSYVDAVAQQALRENRPMMAVLNHPNFADAITIEEAIACPDLRFFEVYSGHPSVNNWGHEEKGYPSTDRFWDVVLSMNLTRNPDYVLYGIATDDVHDYYEWGPGESNPGRGWVMVRADRLTPEALIHAMKAGDFYSSTGVTLKTMHRGENSLSFEIAAEPGVTYTTRFIGTRRGFDQSSSPVSDEAGNPLPRASRRYSDQIGVVLAETTGLAPAYTLGPEDMYVRAVVVSDKPQPNPFRSGDMEKAWIQPVVAR